MPNKLKPCPFCNSKEIYSTREDDFTIVAQCIDCGASGPHALNEEEAIEAWNSRVEEKYGNQLRTRLNTVITFICDLMNKEMCHNWTVFDVLLAVKNCALSGSTILPYEVSKR